MAQKTITTPSYCGIFYQGGSAPTFTITSGASSYSVQDIYSNTVSSGSVSGTVTTLTPSAPPGGWINGWYLLQITGPSSYYGLFPFSVINNDNRFPAAPSWSTSPSGSNYLNENADHISILISGLGTYRWAIGNVTNDASNITSLKQDLDYAASYVNSGSRQPDFLISFTNGVDSCTIGHLNLYRRATHTDAATVAIASGTTTGTYKLTITDTTTSTVVETYDNQYTEQQMQASINAASTWVYCGGAGGYTKTTPTTGSQTLGNSITNGMISTVSSLYNYNSLGFFYFEGPYNEPGGSGDQLAAESAAFTSLIHAGNASAKAIVPTLLGSQTRLAGFIAGCKALNFTPDAVSIHPYNTLDCADLVAADQTWDLINSAMAGQTEPLFCTEFGDFFGERATIQPYSIAQRMVFALTYPEANGVPKERFYWFYPASHGFGFSSWWKNGGNSLCSNWTAARNIGERLYNTTFSNRLTFPDPVNRFLWAPRWTGNSQQTILFQCCGPKTLSITLSVTGASSVSVYDWAGNQSSVPVSNGVATVTATQLGTWVVAPLAGVTITVTDVNNGLLSLSPNYADIKNAETYVLSDGGNDSSIQQLFDPDPMAGDRTGIGRSPWSDPAKTVPLTINMDFPAPRAIDRLVIVGPPPQTDGARNGLTGFNIQAKINGSWTNVYNYSNSTCTSQPLVGSWNVGSGIIWTTMNNWDYTSVFDCKLPQPVIATAWQLVVTSTSYAGEADLAQCTADSVTFNQYAFLRYLGLYLTNPSKF